MTISGFAWGSTPLTRCMLNMHSYERAFMQARGLLTLMSPGDVFTLLVGRLNIDPFVAYVALAGACDDAADHCGHA